MWRGLPKRSMQDGVAAHWAYKDGVEDPAVVQERIEWMKQLLDVDSTSDDAEGFVDAVKTDYLGERVLVFTPAGDVVNLPRGSTPIDFAYQVHTEVGHRTIGARVNGEIVPLSQPIKTGDRIEILTNRSSQYGPSADWLNVVVTRGARQKIKHYFRAQERAQQLDSGKRMLERALRRRGLAVASNMTRAKLEGAATKLLNSSNTDDLLLALDAQRLAPKSVIEVLVPELVRDRRPSPQSEGPKKSVSGVYVDGLDAPASLAQCCGPVRGDDVIGYVTRGRGITVHRVDCPNVRHLMQTEADRFVNVTWDAWESDRQSLRVVGGGGLDTFDQANNVWSPNDLFFERNQALPGEAIESGGRSLFWNWNANAIHTWTTDAFTATSSAGIQYEDRRLSIFSIRTQNLLPGERNVNRGTNTTVDEELTQERTGAAGEARTDAHTILRLDAAARLRLFGHVHSFTLRVDNVMNTAHREATSRIRDFAPAAGRNVAVGYRVHF